MVEQAKMSYWSYPGLCNRPNIISIEKLFKCVELVTGLNQEDLQGPKRFREYVDARQLFTLFLRKKSDLTTTAIGRLLNRDHSTIVYGQRSALNLLDTDAKFKRMYEKIEYIVLNPYVYNEDGSEDENTVGYTKKKDKIVTVKSFNK